MRVVLDTNVIISALISQGPPHRIVAAWRDQRFTALVSAALLAEYERAVHYPKVRRAHGLDDEELERFVGRIIRFGELVVPDTRLSIIAADPDDDRVLECAEAGDASHIVTGDPHLLALERYQEIPILAPRAFLELLDANDHP